MSDIVENSQPDLEEVGACVIPDPSGGPDMCVQATRAECLRIGGVFQGGPSY